MIAFVDVILDLASKDNTDIYVIGSNSKLLSTDIITEFRDRHGLLFDFLLRYIK